LLGLLDPQAARDDLSLALWFDFLSVIQQCRNVDCHCNLSTFLSLSVSCPSLF
jgi:hypothetical protein